MKLAAAAKPAVIALLALALFVPVNMIQNLVAERQARHQGAVAGIAHGWGRRQTVTGPYIVVPYQRTDPGYAAASSAELRIPAESIDWSIGVEVGEKSRGIYRARLYTAAAQVRGRFRVPANFGLTEGHDRISWGKARLVLGVSDPGGIRSLKSLTLGDRQAAFKAGSGSTGKPSAGVHVVLGWLAAGPEQTLEFAFALELAGSEALAIASMGSTAVSMRSDWPHPSFAGRFLPLRHDIGAQGFSAEWKVSQYANPGTSDPQELAVAFVEPAGLYHRLERGSKYGFLFIGLTFAAFLLFELLRRLAIHPIQYALVGLALAMFFVLLTALSEHMGFGAAYTIATIACVGLISVYLARVLRSGALASAFSGALAGLYGMLYALLQAEDYALLGGSVLIFALLAVVMLATRRVDWYALGAPKST